LDVDGKTVTVAVGGETLTLEAVGSRNVPAGTALVSGADGRTIDAAAGDAVEHQTWVRIADDASTSQIEALSSELDGMAPTRTPNRRRTGPNTPRCSRWR